MILLVVLRVFLFSQPLAGSNEQSNLVIRVGRGGAFHVLEEGHCIIGLAAQRHVTKKNKTYLVPDHCMCVVKDSKPVLISCGVAVLRKRSVDFHGFRLFLEGGGGGGGVV